jgi:hypothetical protein
MGRTITRRAVVVILVLASFGVAYVLTPPRGPRSLRTFDADRLAALETGMWQAYYGKERARLFALLVTMLREQYHYSWATAAIQGYHLARAAATFGDGGDRTEDVLPDLEAAYAGVRAWTGATFEARAVARAELAWWQARRSPGRNSVEDVGRLIAEEYALLYESSPPAMLTPALLRARAAALRDAHAGSPDWTAIAELLRQSYRELHLALSSANV